MGIKWQDVEIGISALTNRIFIGKVKPINEKINEFTDKSGDMTNQCIQAVAQHLRQQCKDEEQFKNGIELCYKDGSRLSFTPVSRQNEADNGLNKFMVVSLLGHKQLEYDENMSYMVVTCKRCKGKMIAPIIYENRNYDCPHCSMPNHIRFLKNGTVKVSQM